MHDQAMQASSQNGTLTMKAQHMRTDTAYNHTAIEWQAHSSQEKSRRQEERPSEHMVQFLNFQQYR
jgi:hypothetical protein